MSRKARAGNKPDRQDIELEIADFGPIARGRIVLRPLTVLVGPNNSGKSYASVLAHSVISSCADLARAARSGDWAGPLLEGAEFQRLSARAARLAASGNGGAEVAVPRGLSASIHGCTVGRLFEGSLVSHMGHNFGSHLGALVRTGSRSSKIRIRGPIRADVSISRRGGATIRTRHGGARHSIRGSSVTVDGVEPGARRGRGRAENGRNGIHIPAGEHADRRGYGALLWLAAGIAGHAVNGKACGTSRYLPAARSGVMCAHEALAPGILGGPRNGGSRTAGTVSDLAGSLAGTGAAPRNGSPRGAESIVAGVFGGRLEAQGAAALSYAHGKTSVPMHMSSSGVAGTAPLALAAAGMGPGDTLIVEEPEAHLHPKSQVSLAGQLVGMVRRGMRVILSTHSPFLLEQLGMFVQLGALPPSKRRRTGYGKDEYVEIDEAAAYAFGGSAGRGHTISEIRRSADYGIPQDEFVRVSEVMSRDETRLHYAREG